MKVFFKSIGIPLIVTVTGGLIVAKIQNIDIWKFITDIYTVEAGYDGISYLHMPYVGLTRELDSGSIELLYEFRFHSVRIRYDSDNYYLSILTNGFSNASALGLSCGYTYKF